ncbi:uncharacterized protein [Lolium perenne]|uniref:uncharacterized protein n=1 Tax=Lolium perenne TaxID=4522 RepID=UPI0021F5CAB8|nr:uncharacterized protein LOC127328244 [Lolium perenne]
MAAEDLEWERSKISHQDMNLMKKLGLTKTKDALRFPSDESYPSPPIEYRVSFVDHLIRGLSTPIHDFLRANLAEANKRADALALQLEQSENARKKAESNAAVIEDLRKRLHNAENSLSENITQQTAREERIISRLESQSRRFVRRTQQDYDLENPEGDRLLDALSLLEIHGDEACHGLTDTRTVLSRLFPFHFAKKEEPESFTALAQCFMSKEDLGPSLRQEGLKIGVEGTIALVANSHQDVDWAKVGDVKDMETKKWQSLIKAAKPNSKKILAFLGFKPTPAPSSSKPEVK